MLKQVAIVLAVIAITACGEDAVVSAPIVESAPAVEVVAAPVVETAVETAVEVVATPAVETTEAAVVTEATEVKADEAAPEVEAVATGGVEG